MFHFLSQNLGTWKFSQQRGTLFPKKLQDFITLKIICAAEAFGFLIFGEKQVRRVIFLEGVIGPYQQATALVSHNEN